MIVGECNCGEVAFSIDCEVSDVFVCHCSLCRKATGANGIAVVVVKNEAFAWERGLDRVATWRKPVGDWQTSFCTQCGSTLPGSNGADSMYVPAGLVTGGGDDFRVAHHVFVGSKASWDVIGDDGEQHIEAFGGTYEIPS